jgi:ribonuclease HII
MSDDLTLLSVAALRERFAAQAPTPEELAALQNDARAGVRALAKSFVNRQQKAAAEQQRLLKRLRYEQALWDRGVVHVAGCDEAGMGPLAGPVVAAAVILRRDDPIEGVDDSKLLDPEERDRLAVEIHARAVAWAVGLATHEEIDAINIRQAGMLAMQRALEGLRPVPDHVLLDARGIAAFPVPQTPIIRGDSLSLSIGAASILAKTRRDALMLAADAQYPGYGFAIHKGYPVPMHLEALRRLGACEIHRRTFAPVRDVIEQRLRQAKLFER